MYQKKRGEENHISYLFEDFCIVDNAIQVMRSTSFVSEVFEQILMLFLDELYLFNIDDVLTYIFERISKNENHINEH